MTNQEATKADDMFPGFSVDPEIMFSDRKKQYRKRVERRQRKLAEKFQFLGKFLEQDERVLLFATGYSPMSIWEQLITGTVVFYLKRSLFALTNKRIFHIPTTRTYKYRNSIAEIRFVDCKSLRIKGRTLIVEFKNGKKEKFFYMSGSERKKFMKLLKDVSLEGSQSVSGERTYLCPRCTSPLKKEVYTCPSCKLEFKSKTEGRTVSLIYPGGGYFYTRHPFLGLSDAFVELFLILMVAVSLADTIGGVPEAGDGLILVSMILIAEKIITVYHSNHFIKEFIPKDKIIKPLNV